MQWSEFLQLQPALKSQDEGASEVASPYHSVSHVAWDYHSHARPSITIRPVPFNLSQLNLKTCGGILQMDAKFLLGSLLASGICMPETEWGMFGMQSWALNAHHVVVSCIQVSVIDTETCSTTIPVHDPNQEMTAESTARTNENGWIVRSVPRLKTEKGRFCSWNHVLGFMNKQRNTCKQPPPTKWFQTLVAALTWHSISFDLDHWICYNLC